MTAEQYRGLLEQDFSDIEIGDMKDLKDWKVDRDLPLEERRKSYLEAVGNPYLVRVGNVKVKVRFADNGVSFEEAFENMLKNV